MTEDDSTGRVDFLEGLATEPLPDTGPAPALAPEAPPWPATTQVTDDSVHNYGILAANTPGYGLTGLMAVKAWLSPSYGPVQPGTVFLFPGTYESPPPPFQGTALVNGSGHPPLLSSDGPALHAQLVRVLGARTTEFVGFGIRGVPFDADGNFGGNSGACNIHWFGSRALPPDWRAFVLDALAAGLPPQSAVEAPD